MTKESDNQLLLAYYNSHPADLDKAVKIVKRLFFHGLYPQAPDYNAFDERTFVLMGEFDLLTVDQTLPNYEFPLRHIRQGTFDRDDRTPYALSKQSMDYRFKAINCITTDCFTKGKDYLLDMNYSIVGVVKCVLNKFEGNDHYKHVDQLLQVVSNTYKVNIYKSFSWEDVNIFIYTNSIPEIFECLKMLCEEKQSDGYNIISNTNTVVGFRYQLYRDFIRSGDLSLLDHLDTTSQVEVQVTANYRDIEQHNSLHDFFDLPEFKQTFRAHYTPGIKDFLIRPINSDGRSDTKEVVLQILTLLKSLKTLTTFPDISFESTLINLEHPVSEISYVKRYSSPTIPSHEINLLRKELKKVKVYVPTPLRDMLINLIYKYNNLVTSPRIYYSMLDLYEPLKNFIDLLLNATKSDTLVRIDDVNVYVKQFVKGFKQSINNRLDTSIMYGYHNDYAHNYNLSKHGFLSSVDGYIKGLSAYFSIRPMFCYIDSDQGILTRTHFIKIDAYHLFKSELIAYLFIFELGIRYLEDNKAAAFADCAHLINLGESKPTERLYEAASADLEDNNRKHHKLEENRKLFMEVVFPTFFSHQFCDQLSYQVLFDDDWENFSFWYWSNYLCSYKAKYKNDEKNEKLQSRYRRFYGRYYFMMHIYGLPDITLGNQYLKISDSNPHWEKDQEDVRALFDNYIFKRDVIERFIASSSQEISFIKSDLESGAEELRKPFSRKDIREIIGGLRKYLVDVKGCLEDSVTYGDCWSFSCSGGLIVSSDSSKGIALQKEIFRLRTDFYNQGLKYSNKYRTHIFNTNPFQQPLTPASHPPPY